MLYYIILVIIIQTVVTNACKMLSLFVLITEKVTSLHRDISSSSCMMKCTLIYYLARPLSCLGYIYIELALLFCLC